MTIIEASPAYKEIGKAELHEETTCTPAFVNGRIKLGASVLVLGALTFFFIPGFLKVAGLALLALVVGIANKLS